MKTIKFTLLTVVLIFTAWNLQAQQTARLQVIHNSPDAAADSVDVYVNGTPTLNDFHFRTATSFMDVPAGVQLDIAVAPGNSSSAADAVGTFSYTLTANETYILVANGIVSSSGYSPSPAFDLDVYAGARETAATSGNTDVLVCHGSTDAPTVDVQESLLTGGATIVNDISYGEFNSAGYAELQTENYVLDITDQSGSTVVASYAAPLANLGLQDSAITVVASGFLDPSNNSNGPAFGLFAALPSGGDLIPLPAPTADVQVIHNSADAAAGTVDIYLDGTEIIPDFAFRTATPFTELPAGSEIEIAVAPGNSSSVADAVGTFPLTLTPYESYIVIANGIVSTSGYSPSPAFDLDVYPGARQSASMTGNTDVLVFHGSTDAPVVDVQESMVNNGATIVDDIGYGEFNSAGYLELTTDNYTLDITDMSGSNVVASYNAPLSILNLQNSAITVVASGFLDPSQNSNGPAFGLWAATAGGGPMTELPITVGVDEAESINGLNIYPNPASSLLNLEFNLASSPAVELEIMDVTGKVVLSRQLNSKSGRQLERVDISTFTDGLYLLRLRAGEDHISQSIVIH